jgi:signal transduction histidine kinase
MVSLLGVVAVAATGAASGMELTLGFAVYCVAAELPTRDAWLTAGLATVFMLPAVWFWELPSPDPRAGRDGGTLTVDGEAALSDDRVGTLVGLVIVALAAMAIGTSVRGRRQHLNELLARANAFARDRDQQAELARAAERTRIAREMHDVVAQPLGDDHPGGRGSRRSGPLPGPLPRGAHRAVRDGPLGPGRHAPGAGRAPG